MWCWLYRNYNAFVSLFQVNQLKELIRRIDLPLHEHLQTHGVDYLQFSFRWMNNLLTREIPLPCTIRLWDTYLAESDGFATFQLYVCAAFLLHWRERLMLERDFQGLMILLQNVPTQNWTDSNISLLVAEAYRLKFAFADAPNHLHNAGKSDRWRGRPSCGYTLWRHGVLNERDGGYVCSGSEGESVSV